MQNDVKISVIVPVFNSENYLKKCIDSLVNQNFKYFEVVIVDDASTDKSREIIDEYKYNYPEIIRAFHLRKNSKQGAARNYGLINASGDYVLFVDSDDCLLDGSLSMLYKEAYREDADIVFFDYLFSDGTRDVYCQHVYQPFLGELNDDKKKALMTTSVVPWCKLIRKKLILDNEIFFPEGTFYEDQATTYLYYVYACKVSKVEKALYKYNYNPFSTSSQRNEDWHYAQTDMALLLIERFKERMLDEKFKNELDFFLIEQMYKLGVLYHLSKFDTPNEEYLEKLICELLMKCPNYKLNPYYIRWFSQRDKEMLTKHLQGSSQFVKDYTNKEFEQYCPNYIKNMSESANKLAVLKEYLKSNEGKSVLWGAGGYLQDILKFFVDYRFNHIVDSNPKLWGHNYLGYEIESPETAEDGNFFIIEFSAYKHDIKEKIRTYKKSFNILDLELYLKYNLGEDVENYLEGEH